MVTQKNYDFQHQIKMISKVLKQLVRIKLSTHLRLKLSIIPSAKKMESIKAKAIKHLLKEFLIFGLFKTWNAKQLENIPIMANEVFATPSSQKLVYRIICFSNNVYCGQSFAKVSLSNSSGKSLVKFIIFQGLKILKENTVCYIPT